MPIKSGVLSHLQSAYQEVIDAIVKGNIGGGYDTAKYYVLYGCVNSTTAPIYTVSAGAIFFNGEIYLVDAFTFTATGSNVAVGTITTSFFSGTNADPITFTDSIARNVLQIRKIVFTDAASASGDVDFSSLTPTEAGQKNYIDTIGQPAFQNTWENGTLANSYFQRNKNNLIIKGSFRNGVYSSDNSLIFTLPTGYRPSSAITVPLSVYYPNPSGATQTLSCARLDISTNGSVNISIDHAYLLAAKAVSTEYPLIFCYANIFLL
jgi:hypothetical protein